MKNMNIGRGTAALLASTILLGGCSSTGQTKKYHRPEDNCSHVIINFGNQTIIFKECEGQEVQGDFDLSIKVTDDYAKFIIDGETGSVLIGKSSDYTSYCTDHQLTNEMEKKLVEDGAKVYKITEITGSEY